MVSLEWHDIDYKVPLGKKKGFKQVLFGVSGIARPGEVTAIMGPSGSGKSTLLTLLSGAIPKQVQVSGTLTANGKKLGSKFTQKVAGFVAQDDLVFENLTVRESIEFAAMLRLPKEMSHADKVKRIDDAISELGLRKVERSYIGGNLVRGISGGERKRTSIGLEIVRDIKVLLLDEPTSGLDSFMAMNVVQTLKDLAQKKNMCIITTIHQPRSQIWSMFDKLILLSEGKLMYFGPAPSVTDYFASKGFPCPDMFNPADFILDLVAVDFRSEEVEKETAARVEMLAKEFEKEKEKYLEASKIASVPEEDIDDPSSPLKAAKGIKSSDEKDLEHVANASLFTQISLLCKRAFLLNARDKTATVFKLIQIIFLTIVVGFIFFQVGDDVTTAQDRQGFLFFITVNESFGSLVDAVTKFVPEKAIFRSENKLGYYGTLVYFMAKMISNLPFTIFFPFIFGTGMYWMVGLQNDAEKYFIFAADMIMTSFAAQSIGLFLGALAPNLIAGTIMGIITAIVSLVFGGFYVNTSSLNPFFRAIGALSVVRYSFRIAMNNEFRGLVFTCSEADKILASDGQLRCPIARGEDELARFSMLNYSIADDFLYLFILAISFRFLAYVVLRLQKPRYKVI